jgi:hypothetical protein
MRILNYWLKKKLWIKLVKFKSKYIFIINILKKK